MGRALSRDLRDRVVATVESGLSCRQAAERFGVSAASVIRWRKLVLAHGTPAGKVRGGDRRTAKIEDHAAFILAAIERQPDSTLAELREMLAGRGVTVSIATLWRFFARHGITRKKDRPRERAGPPRRPEASRGMVRGSARPRSRQADLHRQRECQEFRVRAGIMGKKETPYVPTQRACDTDRVARPAAGRR